MAQRPATKGSEVERHVRHGVSRGYGSKEVKVISVFLSSDILVHATANDSNPFVVPKQKGPASAGLIVVRNFNVWSHLAPLQAYWESVRAGERKGSG